MTRDEDSISLTCQRCARNVSVLASFGGSDEGMAYEVTPPCAGMVECERDGIATLHEPNETCPGPEGSAHCPFDGQDDYQSTEEAIVLAVRADRRRRAESPPAITADTHMRHVHAMDYSPGDCLECAQQVIEALTEQKEALMDMRPAITALVEAARRYIDLMEGRLPIFNATELQVARIAAADALRAALPPRVEGEA